MYCWNVNMYRKRAFGPFYILHGESTDNDVKQMKFGQTKIDIVSENGSKEEINGLLQC